MRDGHGKSTIGRWWTSADQLADRFRARIDDADRPTARCLDLPGVVDAQDLADAGHEVLDADGPIDHLGAVSVRLADRLAACEPTVHRELFSDNASQTLRLPEPTLHREPW